MADTDQNQQEKRKSMMMTEPKDGGPNHRVFFDYFDL